MQDATTAQAPTQPATLFTTTEQLLHLEDLLMRLNLKLERASVVLADLVEVYFGKDAASLAAADHVMLSLGYHEHQTKACIVGDYLYELREVVKGEIAECDREFHIVTKKTPRKVSMPVTCLEGMRIAEQG